MGRTMTVILAATVGIGAFAGCDDDGVDRRSALMAGCKTDKDCPDGTVCEKHNCRTPDPKAKAAKKKAEAAKAAKASAKANAEPPANTADLTVRLCPGYWGKSQNTGTMIAKNVATGKKKYLRLNLVVEDEDFEDEFVFKAMPYGRYEVTTFSGVIAQGKQDLLAVDCAERQACTPNNKGRLIDHAAPPPKEEWEKMLKKWQKEEWPGTQKCPKNHECDEATLLRRPCDFDVDREVDAGKK
jgi:hypothetical protein